MTPTARSPVTRYINVNQADDSATPLLWKGDGRTSNFLSDYFLSSFLFCGLALMKISANSQKGNKKMLTNHKRFDIISTEIKGCGQRKKGLIP